MKIAVYAIAKNEEQFVERCLNSVRQADLVVIGDTGSEDRTVEIAKENGAVVYDITVSPWRFDVARNTVLSLVPPDVDVCISLDLDEVMTPGWREKIENAYPFTRLNYMFDWSKGIVFSQDKIHSRKGYSWRFPCHETLFADPRLQEQRASIADLLIVHYPDDGKSRGQYLDLLEVSVKENPYEQRALLYYGRELYFHRRYNEAIEWLEKYLNLSDLWFVEIAYARRLLGNIYKSLGNTDKAIDQYKQAVNIHPTSKSNRVALIKCLMDMQLYEIAYGWATELLEIEDIENVYTRDPTAHEKYLIYDMLALISYYSGRYEEAKKWGNVALEYAPEDSRLLKNLEFYNLKG